MEKIVDFDVIFTIAKIRIFHGSNRRKCFQDIKKLIKQANTTEKAQKAYKVANSIGVGENAAYAKWDKISLAEVDKATSPEEIRKVRKFASPKAISIADDKLYFHNAW